MLRLVKPRRRWLDLPHGVRVEVEPLTTARATAARNEALRRSAAVRAEAEAAERAGHALDPMAFGGGNASALAGLAVEFEIEALARFGIVAWEGLAGDDGAPLPVTPEACEALAQHDELGAAFYAAYTAPLRAVAAEGEGLRLSAGSGGAGAANTAPDATGGPATGGATKSAPADSARPS